MRLGFLAVFLLSLASAFGQSDLGSSLNELDELLKTRDEYVQRKIYRLDGLKSELRRSPANKFYLYFTIYDEYKTFIYDSAFTYARKMQDEAYRSHDPSKIAFAKTKLSFILLSSGMFKEALDSLLTVNTQVHDTIRFNLYSILARTYFDLVDFNRDNYYTQRYTQLGNVYVDSALLLCKENSVDYYHLRAMKFLRARNLEAAQSDLENLLANFKLTDPQIGIAASTLGYIYQVQGKTNDAIQQLINASMADNRGSIKETLAILNLAELLYKRGDVTRAYEYVKVAMDDANYYGARHRKIQVAAIFPIIEGNRLDTVQQQRQLLFAYALAVTVLSVMTVAFAIIIFRQYRKLKEADDKIKLANTNLSAANQQLQEVNKHLMEANKIKEEYIGYYFNINSEYLVKIEAFKQAIENKLMAKKFDDIRYVVSNINLKREREELYYSFDKVFLKLFPDFVSTFNSFFKEEDRIILKEGQLLNMELRIFALIRMGIHDTEKIAKILDYSINTIYNYKARIKSKSLIPNEEFERKIMEIKAL